MISPDYQQIVLERPACVINKRRSLHFPRYAIVFPHKHTEVNDEALKLNLEMIEKHSRYEHEIVIIEDPEGGRIDPYTAWNAALDFVTAPYFVFHNTDMVVGPDWDAAYVRHSAKDLILTDYLIEPGALGCYEKNIHRDFGMCPRCFRVEEFESFVHHNAARTEDCVEGMGYYIQAMLPVDAVKAAGRFPDDVPFMFRPNDAILFEKLEAAGLKHRRVNSWAYHFQNFTARRNACHCYVQPSSRPGEPP